MKRRYRNCSPHGRCDCHQSSVSVLRRSTFAARSGGMDRRASLATASELQAGCRAERDLRDLLSPRQTLMAAAIDRREANPGSGFGGTVRARARLRLPSRSRRRRGRATRWFMELRRSPDGSTLRAVIHWAQESKQILASRRRTLARSPMLASSDSALNTLHAQIVWFNGNPEFSSQPGRESTDRRHGQRLIS